MQIAYSNDAKNMNARDPYCSKMGDIYRNSKAKAEVAGINDLDLV